MSLSWLELNGRKYTRQQLIDPSTIATVQSEFEKSTLQFCNDWLTGKNEFNLTTSGSTGTPKPITLKRHQMEASARLTISALQLKPGYNALVCLDTKYIAGQMMLVRSFLVGMNMIAIEPVANPLKVLGDRQIEFAAFVPYQMDAILREGYSQKLDTLTCAIIGGAAIPESLRRKLQKVKSQLYATYGMTETISHIALQKLNSTKADSFETLGNTKISQDERGCLVIDTDYLDEKVITNDLVNIIDSSHFSWLGRFDNVINSGGVKISPESIERIVEFIFEENHLTNRFFVAGIPDDKLGQRVVLFIEGIPLRQEIQNDVLGKLSTHVSKYELPKEIKFTSEFSQTKSGKVNRLETIKLAKV